MVRFDEQQVVSRLKAVTTPSRHEIRLAKRRILEHLSEDASSSRDEIILRFVDAEGAPHPGALSIILDQTRDVSNLTEAVLDNLDTDPATVRYIRLRDAARLALMELERAGSILGASNHASIDIHTKEVIRVARAGGSDNLTLERDQPDLRFGYLVPDVSYDPGMLDADLFTADLDELDADASTLRLIDESLRAFRHGLFLASATLLAAASEGAWYAAGEKLRSNGQTLGKALDSNKTAEVLRLVTQRLSEAGVAESDELLAHAGVLRRIRNYGLHPRESSDELVEDYFTEEGCGLLLMMARRYLRLLNEGVAQIA